MSSLLRLGLLLTAAAVLPSCGRFTGNDWVHVNVHNEGASRVDVHSEADYGWPISWEDHLDLTVSASESAEFHFNFRELNKIQVRIDRSVDHLNVFDDSWDRSELENLDLRVTITVHP